MADKFRQTHVRNYLFGQGELPDSTKLTGLAQQARDANRLLEGAIGDVWNQGGSSKFNDAVYRNHIANIARAIGGMGSAQPRVVHTADITYVDTIAVDTVCEFALRYYPSDLAAGWTVTTDPAGAMTTRRTTLATMQQPGDYAVIGNTVYTVTPIQAGTVVTYKCDIAGDSDNPHGDYAATGQLDFTHLKLNVFPDPRITTWGSSGMCGVWTDGTNCYIDLPIPDATLFANRASDLAPDITSTYYSGSAYTLPSVLSAALFSATDDIPDGFVYLWDTDSETIVSGLTFRRVSNTRLSVSPLSLVSNPGTAGSPNIARYALVTVGAPLSVLVDNLRNNWVSHDHTGATVDGFFRGQRLSHEDLVDLVTPSGSTNYPSTVPPFKRSRWINDAHPQYLHRAGTQVGTEGTSGDRRDRHDNAMLGHMVFGAMSPSGGSYLHNSSESYGLYFGSSSGPYLHFEPHAYAGVVDYLRLENDKLMLDQGLSLGGWTPAYNKINVETLSVAGNLGTTSQMCHTFRGAAGAFESVAVSMPWFGNFGITNGLSPVGSPRVWSYWLGDTLYFHRTGGASFHIYCDLIFGTLLWGTNAQITTDLTAGNDISANNDVYANADGLGAGDFKYGTNQTGFLSLGPSDFVKNSLATGGVNNWQIGLLHLFLEDIEDQSSSCLAPVHLPNGASISDLQVRYTTSFNDVLDEVDIYLLRYPIVGGLGDAILHITDTTDHGGVSQTVTDSSIDTPGSQLVQNANYFYYIQVRAITKNAADEVYCYSARIRYTYDQLSGY